MSERYPGGFMTQSPPTPSATNTTGVWTLDQQQQLQQAGQWPANGPFWIEDVFSTWLYTGNGSTQTITNGIDLAGKGGLVWIKSRAGTYVREHYLYDTARGTILSLSTDTTGGNSNNSPNGVTAFNSDGFTALGPLGAGLTASGTTYASWTFRKQPKFYTQELISHTNGTATNIDLSSLGTVGYLHAKITNTTGDWIAWHRSLTAGNNLRLNTTAAQSTTSAWLSVSGTTATLSASAPTGSYIIHAFAHNAGGFGLTGTDNVISCGSFTTDGSGNATVNLGYEPQWVLFKRSSGTDDWYLNDTMRGMSETTFAVLKPNLGASENAGAASAYVPTATGFKLVGGSGYASSTYIYIAIRRGPMKVPTTGTSVFNPLTWTGDGTSNRNVQPGNLTDLFFGRGRADGQSWLWFDRLRGALQRLTSNTTNAESTLADSLTSFAAMDGAIFGGTAGPNFLNNNNANYWLRRAPGFFDEVCYTGNSVSGDPKPHNLTVAPEMVIVKNRGNANDWIVWSNGLSATESLRLNLTNAKENNSWFTALPTASYFYPNSYQGINQSGYNYVAYLFASVPGVSKVGSYTGTGTTQVINCGFTAGSRFVMIKRTDSTGDWYVWDSARGIVAGNDPYLLLNSTAAEVTNTDYIDTAATGFEISSTAPAAINANGGSFIFLAIA